jgi:hypothetical protein
MAVVFGGSVQKKWGILFGVWALHGMAAFLQFLLAQNFFIAPSFKQVILGGALMAWILLNLFLIFSLAQKSNWLWRCLQWVQTPNAKDGVFAFAVLALLLRLSLGILQPVAGSAFWLMGYINQISALLNLAAWILVEIIALLLFFAFREQAQYASFYKSFSIKALIVLALLALAALYISQTRMGIDPIYKGDWARGLPAVPLLGWQIFLACLFCVGILLVEQSPKRINFARLDFWLALFIWLAAATLWLSQPVVPNPSALAPHAPNFEIYPFIDAQTYDEFAQSVLIGNGFNTNAIPQRPLYIVFLVFLHLLVGQNYEKVIALQSLVFALFPVLLYLFGRDFFGRPIGVSIALLAIFRDYTSNWVSPFTGNLSDSKVYLSEIPTAMFLILFLLIGIRWVKLGFPVFSAFLMGGVLGLAMLIRTQAVVLLPIIFIFALFYARKKFTALFKSVALLLVTLLLVVTPWLWRNWQLTGSLIFDSPESQTINLALRYSRVNGIEPQALPMPGETSQVYNERLQQMARNAILSNPQGAVRAIFSSFLNHGINNILLLPLQNDVQTPAELFVPADSFWEEWEGTPTASQTALIFFYLFLLSLGIAAAWHVNGWLGLLPLAANLAYNLWTSLALLSGQRFMLSMDWSIYLYYMIGIFVLLGVFLFTLARGRLLILRWLQTRSSQPAVQTHPKPLAQYFFVGALFLLVGMAPSGVEKIFPQKYPPLTQTQILAELAVKYPRLNAACLHTLIADKHLSLEVGRAIYPIYYGPGGGEVTTDSIGYKLADESRLVFQFLGRNSWRIIFPMSEPPAFFPHASDVTLLFDESRQPWAIFVSAGAEQQVYFSTVQGAAACLP